MYNSSYWRNGPVLNNAISGVDQALWDIKGRQAGMPVYELLGGKCREAADLYIGINGAGVSQPSDDIRKQPAAGYRHFRFNIGAETAGGTPRPSSVIHSGVVFDRDKYIRGILGTFEGLRKELGGEVELMNDVHEKITPTQALQLCRDVEKFRPFFI